MACEGGTFGESSLDTQTGECVLTLHALGFLIKFDKRVHVM